MTDKGTATSILMVELSKAIKRLMAKRYFASFAPTYFSDEKWVSVNYSKLLREYLDNWIVVYQEKVIFCHKSKEEIDKFMADKGFTPKDVVTSFVTNRILIWR